MTTSRRRARRGLAMILAAGTAAAGIAGCAPSRASTAENGDMTILGDTVALGLGMMKPYVTVDKSGNPSEVGIRLTAAALDGLPQGEAPSHWMVGFPEEAGSTVVKNAMVNWYPKGRKPAELFGEPQIAFHFYTIDANEAMSAIDPKGQPAKANNLLDAKYVATDYIAEPGDPVEKTVPGMGLHWLDKNREFGPGKPEFTEVFVHGSWDGKQIFLEPLATRKFLLTKPNVTAPVKQPAAVQFDGYYPTEYTIRYDQPTNEYVISIGDMVKRQAS